MLHLLSEGRRQAAGNIRGRCASVYEVPYCGAMWCISKSPRLAQISLPWQQGSAPQHFAWWPSPKTQAGRPKHLRSICHTSRLIGDFVQIWGSKFWALGGLNQKSKNNVLYRGGHGELTAKNGSILHQETKKEEAIWSLWQTDGQTDRVSC